MLESVPLYRLSLSLSVSFFLTTTVRLPFEGSRSTRSESSQLIKFAPHRINFIYIIGIDMQRPSPIAIGAANLTLIPARVPCWVV